MHPLQKALRAAASPTYATTAKSFFKTGKSGYSKDDIFIGLRVGQTREIIKRFSTIALDELQPILHSQVHEERLAALLILVHQFNISARQRKDIFDFYLANTKAINNWDLVDCSADKIIGYFLFHFGKEYPLYKILLTNLAKSSNLWERRIAVVSTFYFIKNNRFDETFHIAELLLNDKHDLIHKAVGWMLREVGKRDLAVLKSFLKKHYQTMPRTMLRYAIERFPEKERKAYLQGTI